MINLIPTKAAFDVFSVDAHYIKRGTQLQIATRVILDRNQEIFQDSAVVVADLISTEALDCSPDDKFIIASQVYVLVQRVFDDGSENRWQVRRVTS